MIKYSIAMLWLILLILAWRLFSIGETLSWIAAVIVFSAAAIVMAIDFSVDRLVKETQND